VTYDFTFDELYDYSRSSPRDGIPLSVTLSAGNSAVHLTASLDTGASNCIFERGYGELLGLDVDAGEPLVFRTATSTFKAFGHAVPLSTRGCSLDVIVYFAALEGFGRNVLGRHGWLNHVRLGLVDYECKMYLSRYEE
jgi:hypothetical protein